MQQNSALLPTTYDHLGHLSGATSDEVPWSVVEPLCRWFTDLGMSNTVFFRAELKRNYEINRFAKSEFLRFRDLTSSLTDAIDNEINSPILRVTVPSAALSILPHFAIVAHEVGHRIRVPYKTAALQQITNDVVTRIRNRLGRFDTQTGTEFQSVIY